ncbi:MAG TPA: hypothetical protein VFX15_00980 [Actinomycetes bacterium]|nr:hypothetical protein [Actinomycetes bacterium]
MGRTARSRRLLTLGVAALVTSMPIPALASNEEATCDPATRVVAPDPSSAPSAMGPRGHAVVFEPLPGTTGYGLILHRPDGSIAYIVDPEIDDELSTASDVNARGAVVGAQRVWGDGTFDFVPWMYRDGQVEHLATSGRAAASDRVDYLTSAINRRGAVLGVKTNTYRGFSPDDVGYVARPVWWSEHTAEPIVLKLPKGAYVHERYPDPLLDFMADGSVSAVVVDGAHRYLAHWADSSSAPDLVRLRDAWAPEEIAGGWIVGDIAGDPGRVFVRSSSEALVMKLEEPVGALDVSPNGVAALYGPVGSNNPSMYVADRTEARFVGDSMWVDDMSASFSTQLLTHSSIGSAVVTCAMNLPLAPEVTVRSIDL